MPVRSQRKKTRILLLNSNQLNAIYRESSFHVKLICQLAVNTGLRLCEIRACKFSDIDLKNSLLNVCVQNTKTKKHERVIPLNFAAKAVIKLLKSDKNSEDFLTDYSDQAFKISCYRLSKKLGFHFSFHSLRHTFITAFYNASRDPYLTAYISGHKSIMTTMIYVHSTSYDARKAINSLTFDFDFKDQNNFILSHKNKSVV